MKKYIILAVTALSFAACTNDEVTTDGEVVLKVNAAISGTATRASGSQWANGDEIGITGGIYTNRPYAYGSSTGRFTATAGDIYFQDTNPVTFSAYYPYTANGTYADVSTSASNQTAENQPKIDFLYASGAVADKDNSTVNFTNDHAFSHCMTQITIDFKEGDDIDFDGGLLTGYSLAGMVLQGSFDTATGVATVADKEAEELSIALSGVTTANDIYTTSVIVFPQSSVVRIGLTVTVEGQLYKSTLTVPDTGNGSGLQPGTNYRFPVTVSKTGLTVGTVEINDWTTVTGTGSTALM